MKKTVFKERPFLWGVVILLVVFGALGIRIFFVSDAPDEPSQVVPAEPPPMRDVVLYFGDVMGEHLFPEMRQIDECQVELDCIVSTVDALLTGPADGGIPIFPPRTRLLALNESEGVAVVDFSREFVQGHPGGSLSELLTLYGLVDTLAENFPFIRGVRILVEGEEVETIKGHVDLRDVVSPDYSYTPHMGEEEEGVDGKVIENIHAMERE